MSIKRAIWMKQNGTLLYGQQEWVFLVSVDRKRAERFLRIIEKQLQNINLLGIIHVVLRLIELEYIISI